MAYSKCPKCEGRSFEVVEQSPENAAYKFMFVQCSGCGSPFGVADYFNIGSLLQGQKKQLQDLEGRLSTIEAALEGILNSLRR
jgi:hypothetical protein